MSNNGVAASPNDGEGILLKVTTAMWEQLNFKSSFVELNYTRLYLAQAGEGDPVILIHGYLQSGVVWRKVARSLADDHRITIPDLRGMGSPDASAQGFDLENLSEDIHLIAKHWDLETVKIVGHDWGGSVAAAYALGIPVR